MKSDQVCVVIPTIRNLTFLEKWGQEFENCTGIIVEDRQSQKIITPSKFFKNVYHFTWRDIKKDFAVDEWIFSRHNAGIRAYGFYKAWQLGAEVIITLDDDCYPAETDFVIKHVGNLEFKGADDWYSTYPDPQFMYTRGFPYSIRNKKRVVISHGLWSGALDLDAKTEVKLPKLLTEKPYPAIRQVIPKNYFFPMCSMNLAFRREATPFMYFPLMGFDPEGNHWGFDRFDDIWAGIFAKKICDHLGWGIVNGSPFVEHRKASHIVANVAKEKPGLEVNERFWRKIQKVRLTQKTPAACYRELTEKTEFPKRIYFTKLKQAMKIWANRFS